MPERIQLRRTKGWRMPPNTVKVDRSTDFGNPWTVREAHEAGYRGTDRGLAMMCVRLFREWVERHPGSLTRMLDGGEARLGRLEAALPTLRGKNLACWCKPGEPCHADVLLELANKE